MKSAIAFGVMTLTALAFAANASAGVTQSASGPQGCQDVALGGPDTNRGVWKAPAGTAANVKSPEATHQCAGNAAKAQTVTGLNRTTKVVKHREGGDPSSINDNEYAYIPVRRFGTIAAPSGGNAGAPKTYAGVRMQQGCTTERKSGGTALEHSGAGQPPDCKPVTPQPSKQIK